MTPPVASNEPHIVRTSRVSPQQPESCECAVPLSLLDATAAKLALSSAVWLLECPTNSHASADVAGHLRTALSFTLNAYPQWCGYLKSILSINIDSLPPETTSFPAHAKRYGRVYVHYGTSTDPGVEFIEAKSTATVDGLYSVNSANRRPIWIRQGDHETLTQFVPLTNVVLALEPNEKDMNGFYKPIMAVQYTALACGGHVIAVKIAHPLADIAALTRFMRDWASVSRAMLIKAPLPVLNPVFEPLRLDAYAAGDINADDADPTILKDALSLPLHRYDWWAPPAKPPSPFPPDLPLAGRPLPWHEWDTKAPVDRCTIHFSREQIDHLWRSVIQESSAKSSNLKISKHDTLLAHIWSCVTRARGLQEDQGPVHCDLVLGTRPAFQLDDTFIGSPMIMLNVEMAASHVASGRTLRPIANRIRETISTVNDSQRLAAHLHSIAYEKSPQRIWQAFLGQRHTLVTTWARAGLYDVEFGLGSRVRYVDGVVPPVNGCVLIIDGPPIETAPPSSTAAGGWTSNGVEVTLPLRSEDMKRLLEDPFLLPKV